MPLFTVQDWIAAAHLGAGQAAKEEEIVTDYAGCKCGYEADPHID
tara:strand:+ start:183 stop:317 length:135 start_codon:yes stop_codon:yes gene_type:complete